MAKKMKVILQVKSNSKKGWWLAGGVLLILILAAFLYMSDIFYQPGFGSDDQAKAAGIAYCARLVENSSWQANQMRDQFMNGAINDREARKQMADLRDQLVKTEQFFVTTQPAPRGYEGPANNVKNAIIKYAFYLDSLDEYLNSMGSSEQLNQMAADTLWDSMAASVFFEKQKIEANAIQGKVLINGHLYSTSFKVFRGY